MSFWIDEGLIGSICKKCDRCIFYDWYLCEFAPNDKNEDGALSLPILECENFKLRKEA